MVLVVLVDEVLEDGARFEETDLLAVGVSVCYGGDTSVWVDLEEPGFLLDIGGDVDVLGFVGLECSR